MSELKVLVSDKLSVKGIDLLKEKFIVDVKTGLTEAELIAIIGNYDALLVRSETKVTANIIKVADRLKIIGRAGVGVDNIDVIEATKKGIIVVNSPEGNTIAAAEHSFAMLLTLTRKIPWAHISMQKGEWKRSDFTGIELFGKTLGVIGLGKIGKRVARYALALGMQVIGYDPYINDDYAKLLGVKLAKLDEVLSNADYLTFHIPKTKETANLINKEKFNIMKDGVYVINCARGGIIVEEDLRDAVISGKVKGAAIDVYAEEPVKPGSVLVGVANIITTPHIGASTAEAQENVAIDVAEQVRAVLTGGEASAAVNIPSLRREILEPVKEYMKLAEKLGAFMSDMTIDEPVISVDIQYRGELAQKDDSPLKLSILKGLLSNLEKEVVNFVNAEVVAKERGIKIVETKYDVEDDYKNLIVLKVVTKNESYEVSGTRFEDIGEMIVSINQQKVNVTPEGIILVVPNNDKPGIIGKIGTLLGENNINIASMQVGRMEKGGNAVMLVNVDQNIDEKIIKKIEEYSEVRGKVKLVQL